MADLYDRDTPPVGIFALRDVVRCLRETGRFVDEEGEATNALSDLLDRLGDGAPASCPGQFCDCGAGCLKAAAGVDVPAKENDRG